MRDLATRVGALPDVLALAAPRPAGPETSLLAVVPVRGAMSSATQQLVRKIRGIQEPFFVGVAGQTAMFADLEHSLGAHLPIILGIVVGATLIILFLFTGSVVLPLKAVLMNFLSLSAMLGILVFIFQEGHLQGLLGFSSEGALDSTQPVFLFAVGFGLATDYGVFLLSRIKEARERGIPNSEAVAIGLERTGRDRDRRRSALRGRPGGLRHLADRLPQGARTGRGAHGSDRCLDHPRPARSLADGAAGRRQLVGAAAACAGYTSAWACVRRKHCGAMRSSPVRDPS